MGRIDGTSRNNRRFAGVTETLQISEHSVEPTLASRRSNLLTHECGGATLSDEPKHVGP